MQLQLQFQLPWLAGTVPVYTVRLERTGDITVRETGPVKKPADIATLVRKHLGDADREHLVCVMLDTKHSIIGISTVSIGILDSALVHPREVFKLAILASCAGIILAHNHPSGDPSPSQEDRRVTDRMVEAGKILGIDVLDHVIIGGERFCSMKEKGCM